jgi:hypothetical protein
MAADKKCLPRTVTHFSLFAVPLSPHEYEPLEHH